MLDFSCLATSAGWTDVLFWALLGLASRDASWKGMDVLGLEVESNTLDALERSADIYIHPSTEIVINRQCNYFSLLSW